MKSMIVLAACLLASSSAYAADGHSKLTVAKLEGRAPVAVSTGKAVSKPASISTARAARAVSSESPVCDYSVETDCR